MFSQNTQAADEQWLTDSLSSFGKGISLFSGPIGNNFSVGAISSCQRSGSEVVLPSYQSYYAPSLPCANTALKTTFATTSFSTPLCQAFNQKTVGTKQEPNLAPPPLTINNIQQFNPTAQRYTLHETPQRHYVRHQYAPVPEAWNPPQDQYTEVAESKKRKRVATAPPRKVRPKVVESKGAIQCVGMNLKKGIRCRNAALMEYFGPRPIYCAEHIEQDPRSIYVKCKSTYQKVPGDAKGCKEVVLKEFSICHKHFEDKLNAIPLEERTPVLEQYMARVDTILTALETEAAQAKKERHDLYQRKNKLIPKFQNMKETLQKFLNEQPQAPQTVGGSFDVLPYGELSFQEGGNPAIPPSLLDNFSTLDEEWKSLLASGLC